MSMYKLIEYSNNYSKISGSLWQYCRDKPDDNITDSKSFKFNLRFTNNADNDNTVNVETVLPLKYLRVFWTTLEISRINCEEKPLF